MRRSFFIFMLIMSCVTGFTQTKSYEYIDTSLLEDSHSETAATYSWKIDTSLYTHPLRISADSLAAWKSRSEFSYIKNLDRLLKLQANQKGKLQKPIAQDQDNTNRETPVKENSVHENDSSSFVDRLLSIGFVQLIFWALAICILLFIVYRLFLNQGIFIKRTTALTTSDPVMEESIEPENLAGYDAMIMQAFKLADYRMAVRYLFLKTLNRLIEKGLLHASAEKTNFRYVEEIVSARKNEFASLVLKYEYIWYGRFAINREQFEQIEKSFVNFYNKI